VEHAADVREVRNAYRILVYKPTEKRQLGKYKLKWEDCIKINLRIT
jgi:hypothetical protein